MKLRRAFHLFLLLSAVGTTSSAQPGTIAPDASRIEIDGSGEIQPYSEGFAAGLSTELQLHADLVPKSVNHPAYANGYADGEADGAALCRTA